MARNRTLNLLSLLSCLLPTASAFGVDLNILQTSGQHIASLQNGAEVTFQGWVGQASTAIVASSNVGADIIGPAYDSYRESLRTSPLETKVATGVVLAVLGDAIAQAREPDEYDKKRAAAFVAFDASYRAVQQWTYPPLMEACRGEYLAGMSAALGCDLKFSDETVALMAAFEQTIVSQFVIIPVFYYPVFYAVTGAVQGLTLDETIQRAKDTFIPLMKRNLLFWIPVQFGVFGFIEESLQIPILIVCGLVWTIILSISAGAVKAPATDGVDPLLEEEIVLAMESSPDDEKAQGSFFGTPVSESEEVQEEVPLFLDDMQNATVVNGTVPEAA